MKFKTIISIAFFFTTNLILAQSADDYGVTGANQYVDGNTPLALKTIDEGIQKYPSDEYLPWLRDKILEDQNDQQQDQDQNQDQNQEDQENQEQKDQEGKEGEESEDKKEEGKEGEQEEKKEGEESEEEGKKSEEDKKKEMEDATRQKLEEMNISPEKARMILEALKNNEIQFIQQQRREPTKQKDSKKPDW
ncbi:MAG: hypothetical protein JXR03_03640 [Cyclobacteriaceae bacterium]